MVPILSTADSIQLQAAADKIAADVEYARNSAMVSQMMHRIIFDSEKNCYEIRTLLPYEIIKHPITKRDYKVNFGPGSQLDAVSILTGGYIEFDYTGIPENCINETGEPGTFVIKIGMDGGGELKVNIDSVTGYTSIE
jgi:hypothetical protein